MTAPYFETDPQSLLRRRLASQFGDPIDLGTDQTLGLRDRVLGLTRQSPQDMAVLKDVGNADIQTPGMPNRNLVGRIQDFLRGPTGQRIDAALQGAAPFIDPTANGAEGFLGSAIRGYLGTGQAFQQQDAQRLATQQALEDRSLKNRLTNSTIDYNQARADEARQGRLSTAPKFGASFWVTDPEDATQEISVSKNPSSGLVQQDVLNGQPLRRPKTASTSHIDPLSPQGIAASGRRAKVVAGAVSSSTPSAAIAQTRAFATRAENALGDIDTIPVPTNTEYEVGSRSPVEAGRSQTYRLWRTKALQFIYPILRKETGAAISNQEFADAVDLYIPKPGDSAAVKAAKRQNRVAAIKQLREMGNQSDAPVDIPDYTSPP